MKNTLKSIKLNESTISMALGAAVIIVVGLLVVNYFNNINPIENLSDGVSTSNSSLPTSHVVGEGETLWNISEKYYDTGYNWVDIQEANDLANANAIEKGQTLVIPDVEPRSPDIAQASETSEPEATISPEPTDEPVEENAQEELVEKETNTEITDSQYTVVRGDTLWDIAVAAYGDGYRWTDIAEANNLVNPDLIHAGNVLTLPGK